MNSMMKGISVKIPEKVFFSKDIKKYIVKNDFHFTIFKSEPVNTQGNACAKQKGETYPTIYIKGFEQLFTDDETRANQLDLFFKMFNTGGSRDWSIGYGRFRGMDEYCAVITVAAETLEADFSVGLQLSDKCIFTNVPETASPIELSVYIDDFHLFFADVPQRIMYSLSLERGFSVYIEDFGAYRDSGMKTPVTAVHKGESCDISWKIEKNQKASAFLYDENGAIVANLPPYTTKINRDRRFTLIAYNDACSVTQSLTVYRTLWEKECEADESVPKTDKKGRFKVYQGFDDNYFLYVHPILYSSTDFRKWKVYSENTDSPPEFSFYSSAASGTKFCVCYLSGEQFTYCEMNFADKQWKRYDIERQGLTAAYALRFEADKTVIVLADRDNAGIFDLADGGLTNGRFLEMPGDVHISAVDVLAEDSHSYLTVLYDSSRAYFYDLDDDFKNNIFECPDVTDDNLYLIKSNAIYMVLNGCMLEVSDREKFTDLHFFPKVKKETHPIIGRSGSETILGIFQTETGNDVWIYKF